jgi:hypothetical protein
VVIWVMAAAASTGVGVGMGVDLDAERQRQSGVGTYRVPHFDEVINIDDSTLQVVTHHAGLLWLLLRLLGSSNGNGLVNSRGQLLLLDLLGARHFAGGCWWLWWFGVFLQLSWLRAAVSGLQSGGLEVNGGPAQWSGLGAGCSWCGGVFGLML